MKHMMKSEEQVVLLNVLLIGIRGLKRESVQR